MLQDGGNAVDAAVAAALVESAVNPNVSGLGGSGGMVIYLAGEQRCLAIDYNTRAPESTHEQALASVLDALTPDRRRRLLDAGWSPYQLMLVPGCIAGLDLAVRKYGRKAWRDVAAPALEALDGGLYVHERLARELPGLIKRAPDDETRGQLTIDGRTPRLGERLPLRPFVELFEHVADQGADVFYQGTIADRLVGAIEKRAGALCRDDFASYCPREVEPLKVSYRGYDVCTCPLTLGGASVLQMLNVLEGYDLAELKPNTPGWAELLAQVYRLVWRDRLDLLGDPEKATVDVARLLSKDYAAQLRAECPAAGAATRPTDWRGGPGTIHISAADREGNMVALTQSLIGGGAFVRELGLLMNQALIMFDPRPTHPNCPGPRKQPLVNMSPTLILKQGRPLFALGAPGARHILSAVSQIVVNLTDFGMSLTEAIVAPRVHCEADGPVLVEACVDGSVRPALEADGYGVEVVDAIGALGHIVGFDGPSRRLMGATDQRDSRSQWDGQLGTVAAV